MITNIGKRLKGEDLEMQMVSTFHPFVGEKWPNDAALLCHHSNKNQQMIIPSPPLLICQKGKLNPHIVHFRFSKQILLLLWQEGKLKTYW